MRQYTKVVFSITDFRTPRDRFVQAVKWYLSAFHAGRKSPVAKKPYNPILGETFQCFYDLGTSSSSSSSVSKKSKFFIDLLILLLLADNLSKRWSCSMDD